MFPNPVQRARLTLADALTEQARVADLYVQGNMSIGRNDLYVCEIAVLKAKAHLQTVLATRKTRAKRKAKG